MTSRLRIAIITQGVNPMVRGLLASGRVVGVAESRWRCPGGFLPPPPAPSGLRQRLAAALRAPRHLGRLCRSADVPYWYMTDGATAGFLGWLRDLKPDLLCVYSMSELLPAEALSIPRLGAINLHGSLLPAYRGPQVYWWMLWDGASTTGPTVHRLDASEDTGPIIAQRGFPITPEDDMTSLSAKTIAIGAGLMLQAVEDFERGTVNEVPQPATSPTLRARRVRKDELPAMIRHTEWQTARLSRVLRAGLADPRDLAPALQVRGPGRWTFTSIPHRAGGDAIMVRGSRVVFNCADGALEARWRFSPRATIRRVLTGHA